jgi:hypothetical protein
MYSNKKHMPADQQAGAVVAVNTPSPDQFIAEPGKHMTNLSRHNSLQ